MNNKLNQKYLKPTRDISSVTVNSSNLLNVIDMIRTYPTAARILLYLTANTEYAGAVKSDQEKIANALNITVNKLNNCIRFLIVNGYLETFEDVYLISLDMLYANSNTNTSFVNSYAKAYDERISDEELEYIADVEQEWEDFNE